MAKAGELAAAQRWLQIHSASPHTRRKYEAQLQQLCEWLLLRGRRLASVSSDDLQAYLATLAGGELSKRDQKGPLSHASVRQARSVVTNLFDFLVQEGVRPTNPAWATIVPAAPTQQKSGAWPVRVAASMRWLDIRAKVLEQARANETPRSPLRRAVAIAELASWSGLRRSELAAATMDSFVQMHGQWWIRVARFGHGETDLIEVPQPAMHAVSLYRLCRDLPELPAPAEHGVPLIASIRSERPVHAWTIADALKNLAPVSGEAEARSAQSIVTLRREVASEALKARIASHQVARHMRSITLVDQMARSLAQERIAADLARLAA